KQPGHPGADRATRDREYHQHSEDRAEVRAFENLRHDRAEHRGRRIAEEALREDHGVDQHRVRPALQRDQRRKADYETEAADRPRPFAPDTIRQVTEDDLSRNPDETDDAERPGRL